MTADELLTALFNAGIAISIGATVLSLGLMFTVPQLVAPLRRVGLVLATLGAGTAAALKAARFAKRVDLPLAVSRDRYAGVK